MCDCVINDTLWAMEKREKEEKKKNVIRSCRLLTNSCDEFVVIKLKFIYCESFGQSMKISCIVSKWFVWRKKKNYTEKNKIYPKFIPHTLSEYIYILTREIFVAKIKNQQREEKKKKWRKNHISKAIKSVDDQECVKLNQLVDIVLRMPNQNRIQLNISLGIHISNRQPKKKKKNSLQFLCYRTQKKL